MEASKSLLNGRFLKCPKCEVEQDILLYVPLAEIEKYATETQPIYKCKNCRWVFSPSTVYESFRKWKVGDA